MRTAIDWAARPAPWCWIGPAFAAEVHAICGREIAPPADRLPDITGLDLRARMIKAKLSPLALSKRVGCGSSMIRGLLSGSNTASSDLWARIDGALDAAMRKRGLA